MEKIVKTFKHFSEKGYKHYTENTIEELDKLSLDSPDIITEFAHLGEWLRVNHGISIYILPYSTLFRPYSEELIDKDRFGKWEGHKYSSPQEAYSAAFDYVLTKLI